MGEADRPSSACQQQSVASIIMIDKLITKKNTLMRYNLIRVFNDENRICFICVAREEYDIFRYKRVHNAQVAS